METFLKTRKPRFLIPLIRFRQVEGVRFGDFFDTFSRFFPRRLFGGLRKRILRIFGSPWGSVGETFGAKKSTFLRSLFGGFGGGVGGMAQGLWEPADSAGSRMRSSVTPWSPCGVRRIKGLWPCRRPSQGSKYCKIRDRQQEDLGSRENTAQCSALSDCFGKII